MELKNLFSFHGQIGRAQLWVIMIAAGAINGILSIFPVSPHKVVFNTHGGFGEDSVTYSTPMDTGSIQSWVVLAVFYLVVISICWVTSAAMVKRLHDLEKSGKWVAYFFATLALYTVFVAVLSRFGGPLPAFDIISTIFLIPICAIGAWGMFLMLFAAGQKARTATHKSDLRSQQN